MSEPACPQKAPYPVDLEPGDYYWCSCGQSKNQPFCDGSHQGTDFTPEKLTVTEKGTFYLCGCKRTSDKPMCDGTHSKL